VYICAIFPSLHPDVPVADVAGVPGVALLLLLLLQLLLLLLLLVSCMQMFDSVALLFRSVPFGLALGRRIWRWRASARTRVPENHLPLLPGVACP